MATTTIQISNTTRQSLEQLKEQRHAASYDVIIQQLIQKQTKVPSSMFGAIKGFKWKKEDRMETDEL